MTAEVVDVDHIKTRIWGGERREWSDGMCLKLGALTLYTGACPATNMCIGICHTLGFLDEKVECQLDHR